MHKRTASSNFWILIFLFLSAFPCQRQDEQNPCLQKNNFGMAPLHLIPWTLNNGNNKEALAALDDSKATIGAHVIKYLNADVNDLDIFGQSPFTYAKGMKHLLPHVFEVINAGRIIQAVRKKLPQPDANGAYNISDLIALRDTNPISEDEIMEWHNAERTLEKYLPKEG